MDWPILQSLSDEDRRQLLREARPRRYRKNEVVFHEGDPADTLHLVVAGRVAVRVTTEWGDQLTFGVLGRGQMFGELALLSPDSRRTATVVALEPTQTLTLHRTRFDHVRRTTFAVDRFLVELLAGQVARLSERLVEALFVPVEQRVLRRVAAMAAEYGADSPRAVIPLTQQDLAHLAGTTRATANRVLRAAEERGVLRMSRGRVEVLDVRALKRAAR